jgi:hypothetical protein
LRRQQQDMYGQQVNALLMQIREAQEQVAQAAELRRKAEDKCNTARECMACIMQHVCCAVLFRVWLHISPTTIFRSQKVCCLMLGA